ncbi:hypothetical protein FAI40_03800 [Acetobacteraceae bacterium]|nr:hypothetical protein FAI40_03800 [Acetobacteraceae bacterium]
MKKRFLLPLSALFLAPLPTLSNAAPEGVYSHLGSKPCHVFTAVASAKSSPKTRTMVLRFQAYGMGISDMAETTCLGEKPKEQCAGEELDPQKFLLSVFNICQSEPNKKFGDAAISTWDLLNKKNIEMNASANASDPSAPSKPDTNKTEMIL